MEGTSVPFQVGMGGWLKTLLMLVCVRPLVTSSKALKLRGSGSTLGVGFFLHSAPVMLVAFVLVCAGGLASIAGKSSIILDLFRFTPCHQHSREYIMGVQGASSMTFNAIDLPATTQRLVEECPIHSVFRSDIQHDLWRQLAILAEQQLRAEGIWWSERRMAARKQGRYRVENTDTITFQAMRVLRKIIPAQPANVVELLELEELKSQRAGKTITSLHLAASEDAWSCVDRVVSSFKADVKAYK